MLDMVCKAATTTEERKKFVDFSRPYFDSELAIVTGKVGIRRATTAADYVKRRVRSNSVHVFDMNADAYRALQAGELDAGVDDDPIDWLRLAS